MSELHRRIHLKSKFCQCHGGIGIEYCNFGYCDNFNAMHNHSVWFIYAIRDLLSSHCHIVLFFLVIANVSCSIHKNSGWIAVAGTAMMNCRQMLGNLSAMCSNAYMLFFSKKKNKSQMVVTSGTCYVWLFRVSQYIVILEALQWNWLFSHFIHDSWKLLRIVVWKWLGLLS